MKIGDLVGLPLEELSVGLIVGFDLEGDPIVEWLVKPPRAWSEVEHVYRECLTTLSGVESGV